MLPDILNYVPDPNNGRPLAGAKVYFLVSGYIAPDQDSDLDLSKIAPITADGSEVPQPLYTSQGGTIRVGSQVNQPSLIPSGLTNRVAVYDKCGKLVYQVGYSAEGAWVSSAALAASDSSVLIGGITAEALVALASGGGGSGNGIDYVTTMPTSVTEGQTIFQQNSYDLGFSINDGDSTQIVEFNLLGAAAFSSGGGGGSTYTFANSSGTGSTLLKTISATSYEWKRIKAGLNVSVTDDGNELTINAGGGGGGGGGGVTTLSNAGATGLGFVLSPVGSDYPIKRIQAGTNVTITDNGTYYTIDATGGGGGGISSLANVNDAIGFAVYKETTAGVGYFRRVQSSDSSLIITTDVSSVDFQVNSILYTKINTIPTARLLGRSTAGTGAAEVITLGTNLSFSGATLNATGGVTDGDKGDIVVSGSGSSWVFDPTVVTSFAKTFLDDTTAGGVRSTIGAQATSTVLDNIASASWAANKLLYSTGATSFATSDLTSIARTVLAGSTITAMLNALGILTLSNANGTTLRFPTASATTGIQICFKTGLSTGSITNTHGSIFSGGGQQWDYPNIFSATPSVTGFVTDANAAWVGGGLSSTTSSAAFFRGFSGVSGTTAAVCMIAIGTY